MRNTTTSDNRNVPHEAQRNWAAHEAAENFDKAANAAIDAGRAMHTALTPIAGNDATKRKHLDEITLRASAAMKELSRMAELAGIIANGKRIIPKKGW